MEFAVNATAAGPVPVVVRFANGTTTNRPMDLIVNDSTAVAGHAFNPTGNWDTWATATFTATPNAGTNLIRPTATTANGGPNLDKITIG